ncbi:prominin-like protein [Drosophila ficusphila]|uniref:prominin-like protein n=1 Tax=Drosophila ficusphila TaxID=30025 RepID=UPI0007E8329B|nr:prominin-like protein [Drosophila ficusphila]
MKACLSGDFLNFLLWVGVLLFRLVLVDCQSHHFLRPYNILIERDSLAKFRELKPQNRELQSETRTEGNDTFGKEISLGPITCYPHAFTRVLVNGSKNVPEEYMSNDGNDIGPKVKKDEWAAYLRSQPGLKIFVFLLILLLLLVPIIGLIYACYCARCKKVHKSSKGCRYCCGILLALLAFLMLLFLIFALLATIRLNKGLTGAKSKTCLREHSNHSQTNEDAIRTASKRMNHSYIFNYNQLRKRINGDLRLEPNVSQAHSEYEKRARELGKLVTVLRNMPKIKPLMKERFKNELAKARPLATQFRDALRGVKRDLMVILIAECKEKECQDFYKNNDIGMLDMGCLHYDSVPEPDGLIKAVQEVIDSGFINIPRKAVHQLEQISKAIKDNVNKILDKIRKALDEAGKKLQKRHEASLMGLRRVVEEMKKDKPLARSQPAAALGRKLGSGWYGITIGLLVLLMFVILLLLIALLVALSSPKIASWLLCAFLVAVFLLFALSIILVLFYLVHGALLYQAFCLRNLSQSVGNKSIDPNEILSKNITLPRPLPTLRASDILESCVRNESLYKAMGLEEIYDVDGLRWGVLRDVRNSLEEVKNASQPGKLVKYYPEAERAAQKLLRGKINSYSSKNYTKHVCRELVPKPRPGPLPALARKLDNLAEKVDSGVALKNQATHLRAYQSNLGDPLAAIVEKLMNMLKLLDLLLMGEYRSFADYIKHLLAKIKEGDELIRRDVRNVTAEVADNVGNIVESALDEFVVTVTEATEGDMGSCGPLIRDEVRDMKEYSELCNRIAKPMNAIWFWLLLFSLLLLPALCCTHFLRCRLASLGSTAEENFVTPVMLPMNLPPCYCKYVPVAAETNVDHLEGRDDFYVDQFKRKRE